MNPHNPCPCCSEPLLRHARRGGVYWFCPHCHQEMPNLSSTLTALAAARQPRKVLESMKALDCIPELLKVG
jgi:ribosomal protein L37AE/L43A